MMTHNIPFCGPVGEISTFVLVEKEKKKCPMLCLHNIIQISKNISDEMAQHIVIFCCICSFSLVVPEQVSPPSAVSLTPASIELKWTEPDLPNGVISLYTIERRLPGKVAVTTVVSLSPTDPKVYMDEDKDLTPYTNYEYRLVVTNGAGEGYSSWVLATTMSSRKLN